MSLEHSPGRESHAESAQPRKLTGTVEEAATVLGVGRNHAYEMAKSGEIPAKRYGGRIVVLWQPFMRTLGVEGD